MKIECTIKMDLETTEYEIRFSHGKKGEEIPYFEVKDLLQRIIVDFAKQIEESGIESTEKVTKSIH